MRVLSYKDLRTRGIPYSPEWLRVLIARGEFPKPLSLGSKRIAFVEAEIDQWLKDRAAAREDLTTANT
jgi:prophage regulatory protein